MFDDKIYTVKRWIKPLKYFSKELTSLRTGRANAATCLDLIKVDVYGQAITHQSS